jgi:hypothetical protein
MKHLADFGTNNQWKYHQHYKLLKQRMKNPAIMLLSSSINKFKGFDVALTSPNQPVKL